MDLVSRGLVRGFGAVAVAAATVALVPATAGAATPVELGNGADVSLAVDGAGTAHVAWPQQGGADVTTYCRVPTGGATAGCPGALTFGPDTPTNGLFGRSLVAVSGGTVIVGWRECCAPEEVNARISGDGGASFPTSQTLADVGPDNPASTSADAVTNGTFIDWGDGVAFQRAGLGAAPSTTRADLFGPVGFASSSALIGDRPLVVGESDLKQLSFRRSPSGDVNSEASWTAAKPIATVGDGFKRPELAFDSEIFLAYTDQSGSGDNRPLVRPYLAGSDAFADPVMVADQSANHVDLAIDGAGRLHVVWANSGGSWWSVSDDRGASFGSPVRLTEELGGITQLRVGVGTDGSGFAGLRTVDGKVWVVPLEDTDSPEVDLGGRSSTRVGKVVRVKATCGEDCELRATGTIGLRGGGAKSAKPKRKKLKLRAATASALAGERTTLKLRLSGKVRKRVTRALKKGAKATAKIKVKATDGGGNATTAKKRVKLKRKRR